MEGRYSDFSTISDFGSVVFVLHWENESGEADRVGAELDKLFDYYRKGLDETSYWPVVFVKYGLSNKYLLPNFSDVPNFGKGKTIIFKLIGSKLEQFTIDNSWKFDKKKLEAQGIAEQMNLMFIKNNFEEPVPKIEGINLHPDSLNPPSAAIPPKEFEK